MGDVIMSILLYIGLLGIVIVPVSTVFLKKTKHRKMLSIAGVTMSIFLIFIVAPNISVDGGFTDMLGTITGILLLVISITVYQIFCTGNKNNK